MVGYTILFDVRRKYKDYFVKINSFMLLSMVASFFSRYASRQTEVQDNALMISVLVFLLVMIIVSLIDKNERNDFEDIALLYVFFFIGIISSNMLIVMGNPVSHIVVMGIIVMLLSYVMLNIPFFENKCIIIKKLMYFFLWLPTVIRVALEVIFFLTEKGRTIQRYSTYLNRVTIVFAIIAILIVFFLRKREKNFKTFGYVGAIVSIASASYIPYKYQYVWSYSSMARIYELGNGSVAMDTVLNGKIPIVDYFSAHAIGDVWTRIIYCLIHNDIKGILVDPYSGLANVIAFVILFYTVKELFSEETSLLYVLFFPGIVTGIKWVSICSASIAMLLFIYRKPSKKSYIIFWITVLLGAFYTYDEGISLGLACILAYVIMMLIQRELSNLKVFVVCGATVGGSTLGLYIVYALTTGISVVERIKEWLSVSVGSSSTWATENYGDPSTFAFLFSYFIVPITAVTIFIAVIVRYMKTKNNGKIVVITVAYALTEIFYITRTIVFHNLAVCSGITGVLLNYVHWTVSLYVLYRFTEKEVNKNKRFIGWTVAMLVVILMEGTIVTSHWPEANSTLISRGIKSSERWELTDSVTKNIGKDRIVYDDESAALVNKFSIIFDSLLEEQQTFIDFANITSMYLLTGRERPCYVGQTPSLLTDIYSQECYLKQVEEYECPLAVLGNTETAYIQQMQGIPHNVRYYKIAEYIYGNYRPLVSFGEFVIWCQKDYYEAYSKKLTDMDISSQGYAMVDYGYDFTMSDTDENGQLTYIYNLSHSYDLNRIPYIWANLDDEEAINNKVLVDLEQIDAYLYKFKGSQGVKSKNGNYIAFECINMSERDVNMNVVFYDSTVDGARSEYYLRIVPGTNQYLIRASQDYFWEAYNIDTVLFGYNDNITIEDVRVLEGD